MDRKRKGEEGGFREKEGGPSMTGRTVLIGVLTPDALKTSAFQEAGTMIPSSSLQALTQSFGRRLVSNIVRPMFLVWGFLNFLKRGGIIVIRLRSGLGSFLRESSLMSRPVGPRSVR